METISQGTLRKDAADVLRRVATGEHFTVTVDDRPVAELRPESKRHWLSGPALAGIWESPAPRHLEEDLSQIGADLSDPSDR